MFLRSKIKSSSLAEVVIAIAVIALCFGIASLVFVRAMSSSCSIQEIRKQTEIQSHIWEAMHDKLSLGNLEELDVQIIVEGELSDSLKTVKYIGVDDKLIWEQQSLYE